MVDQSLVEYLGRLLKQGYTPDVLRSELIKQGHSPIEINAALALATPKKTSWTPFIAAGTVLMTVVIVGLILLMWPKSAVQTSPTSIALAVLPPQDSFFAGDILSFTTRYRVNPAKPTDVQLQYHIISPEGKDVQNKLDTAVINDNSTQTHRLPIDVSLPAGTYTMRLSVKQEGTSVQQEFSFTVKQRSTTSGRIMLADCPRGCDDLNSCTDDFCQEGRCVHVRKKPCCGNTVCEPEESVLTCAKDCQAPTISSDYDFLTTARTTARTNKQKAAELCMKGPTEKDRDDCLSTLAEDLKDPLFCNPLAFIERKDSCYLSFALQGTTDTCPKINDPSLRSACFQYAHFAALQNKIV